MITVQKQIDINKQDLGLFMEFHPDSGSPWRQKGHSLTIGFLTTLCYLMSGALHNAMMPTGVAIPRIRDRETFNDWLEPNVVTNATNATPIRVTITGNGDTSNMAWNSPDKVAIGGVLGNTAANGLWDVANVSLGSTQSSFDLVGSSGNGAFQASNGGAVLIDTGNVANLYANENTFAWGPFLIGRGTQANVLLSPGVFEPISNGIGDGQLDYGANTRLAPVYTVSKGSTRFSKTFSNAGAINVDINELALFVHSHFASGDFERWRVPICRDSVLVVLQPGKSVLIHYDLEIETQTTGGLLRQFTDLLYRYLESTEREVKDVDNISRNNDHRQNHFLCYAPPEAPGRPLVENNGFDSSADFGSAEMLPSLFGPQLGISDEEVAIDNFRLQFVDGTDAAIHHGTEQQNLVTQTPGQMRHLGSYVEPVVYDEVNDEAHFDIVKHMRNESGANIVAKEMGLYTGALYDDSGYATCIARHHLAAPITIPDGEVVKVLYRFAL